MPRTLLAVCGNHPQIITETLYALWRTGLFPDKMLLLTSEEGKAAAENTLLGADSRLARLISAYQIPAERFDFSAASLLTPRPPISDIGTADEALRFLDLCMETVFREAARPDVELLFSIAGGRKTMGIALTLAAQCYARPQDRMFHTLVPSEYEQSAFFYPVPDSPSQDVAVTLVPVPFFQLRPHLSPERILAPASAGELALEFSHPARLALSIRERTLTCGTRSAQLPPVLFALYLFFLSRRQCPDGCLSCPPECAACAVPAADLAACAETIRRCYSLVAGNSPPRGTQGILQLSQGNFLSYLTGIKNRLKAAFGSAGYTLAVQRMGKRRQGRYGIRLPFAATVFTEDEAAILLGLPKKMDSSNMQT